MSSAGTHLIGAATHAGWAAFWPNQSGPFAKPMNEIPKVVFSNSLQSANWPETTIATGDLAEAVTRLKQERSGGHIATGLIDEYRLVVFSGGAVAHVFTARPSPGAEDERRP